MENRKKGKVELPQHKNVKYIIFLENNICIEQLENKICVNCFERYYYGKDIELEYPKRIL